MNAFTPHRVRSTAHSQARAKRASPKGGPGEDGWREARGHEPHSSRAQTLANTFDGAASLVVFPGLLRKGFGALVEDHQDRSKTSSSLPLRLEPVRVDAPGVLTGMLAAGWRVEQRSTVHRADTPRVAPMPPLQPHHFTTPLPRAAPTPPPALSFDPPSGSSPPRPQAPGRLRPQERAGRQITTSDSAGICHQLAARQALRPRDLDEWPIRPAGHSESAGGLIARGVCQPRRDAALLLFQAQHVLPTYGRQGAGRVFTFYVRDRTRGRNACRYEVWCSWRTSEFRAHVIVRFVWLWQPMHGSPRIFGLRGLPCTLEPVRGSALDGRCFHIGCNVPLDAQLAGRNRRRRV
jgi:hypothetical protein